MTINSVKYKKNSKKACERLKLYNIYSNNLNFIKQQSFIHIEPNEDDGFICPICFKLFTIGTYEAAMAGCYLLNDSCSDSLYYLYGLIQRAHTREQKTEDPRIVNLIPTSVNSLRKQLYQMVLNDPMRRKSALSILLKIDKRRLESGKPQNETRHPYIQSEKPWPLLI